MDFKRILEVIRASPCCEPTTIGGRKAITVSLVVPIVYQATSSQLDSSKDPSIDTFQYTNSTSNKQR